MTLEETLEKIHPADKTAMEAALAHWNNIAAAQSGTAAGYGRSYRRYDRECQSGPEEKSSGGHVRR